MMDSECLSLLPAVCLVLADPRQSPPDDTSLEKLLDWFKDLHSRSNGQGLLQDQPCLLEFISSVCTSKATDPTILSFTLQLTGLLASTKQGFHLLEEKGLLVCVFEREGWCVCDLWEDASVRSGWLQGLLNMLKHQQALNLICEKGLIKVILQLQNDKSLFVASLANQLLVNILHFLTSSHMTNGSAAEGSSESSLSSGWDSISSEIMNGVVESLRSEDHQVLQGLRLLSLALCQCGEPIRSRLWKDVLVPLEVLISRGSESLTQPLMAVLQAAVMTPLLSQSGYKLEELLEAMLGSGDGQRGFQCATLIIKLDKCPEVLRRKALDIVLFPLKCVSTQSQDAAEKNLKDQLSQKAASVSLLVQSLSSLADLADKKYLFEGISIHSVTCSVVLLLRICSGHCPSSSLHINACTHLIGCGKVQRCGLDALGALSMYEENVNLRKDIFSIFMDYLQSPDSHATVLKKTFQATARWIGVCSSFPDLLQFISHELFPVLEKRLCDVRWEVRDSTLEFITQLTVALRGNRCFTETLYSSGMVSVLLASLTDAEGYVRASAVAAVGEAVTSSLHQTALVGSNNLLEAVTQMMAILSQDTEGFPRRAVVKTFTSWLKGSQPVTDLDSSLSSVLSLGGNDFDWEVKMHTLELSEILMEKTLNCCPYAIQNSGSSENAHLTRALSKLKEFELFDLLLKSLFDCDRPVCEKACALLLKLRTLTVETTHSDGDTFCLNVCGSRWGDEVQNRFNKQHAKGSVCVMNGADERSDGGLHCIRDILQILDLDDMQRTLKLSSDHVVNSPQSLMEDILSAAQQSDENIVDCY